MKYVILCLFLSFSLTMSVLADESNIINGNKLNQILSVENNDKSLKEQDILMVYKERLNLLSIKERQLKLYEQSLVSLKEDVNILQSDLEIKQSKLNEKEIALLKKELQLKEKQRDLEQLEEKLAQIDTIQLQRENSKRSEPSIDIKTDLKIDTNYIPIKIEETKVKEKNKVEKTTERRTTKKESKNPKIKNVPYINSGLGEMKKEILSGNVIEK